MVPGRDHNPTPSRAARLSTASTGGLAPRSPTSGQWHMRPGGLARLMGDLLDLAVPRGCAGCQAPGASVCPSCAAVWTAGAFRHHPRPNPAGLIPVHAATAYIGPARSVLVAWKERQRHSVAPVLAQAMAQACCHALGGQSGRVHLVPVPASSDAVRRRGGDVLRQLAERAAREVTARGIPCDVVPLLHLVRIPEDQAGLSAARRAVNLHDAMSVTSRPVDGTILIVDDVVTTGATLVEASRALAAAGVPAAAAAVMAATSRRY